MNTATIEVLGRTLEIHFNPLFEPAEETYGHRGSADLDADIQEIIWIDGDARRDVYWAIDCESDLFGKIHKETIDAAIAMAKDY